MSARMVKISTISLAFFSSRSPIFTWNQHKKLPEISNISAHFARYFCSLRSLFRWCSKNGKKIKRNWQNIRNEQETEISNFRSLCSLFCLCSKPQVQNLTKLAQKWSRDEIFRSLRSRYLSNHVRNSCFGKKSSKFFARSTRDIFLIVFGTHVLEKKAPNFSLAMSFQSCWNSC